MLTSLSANPADELPAIATYKRVTGCDVDQNTIPIIFLSHIQQNMLATTMIRSAALATAKPMVTRPAASRLYSTVITSVPKADYLDKEVGQHPQAMPLTDTTVYAAQGEAVTSTSEPVFSTPSFSPTVNVVFDD